MKRCPQCNRDERDDALTFCRVDGTPLVRESGSMDDGAGTLKFGSSPAVSETETRILPQAGTASTTDEATSRPTAPTTALEAQRSAAGTKELNKPQARRARVLITAAVLVALLVGFAYYFLSRKNYTAIESVAVLPFVNESGNADVEYLSDGMTESLIGSLSQLPNLSVKARASVFRYKGKEIDPKRIGQELDVQAILTGRVVQRGQDLTLYSELIDAATENVLWKADYNRSMSNLVSLQSEIAKDVSNKLKTKLSGADERQVTKTYTENAEAYQLYLKGLYHWNKRTGGDFKQAIALFQQAIDKDPGYAKAYGGLAITYAVFGSNTASTGQEVSETRKKAKAAALKALELDNNLAEAHAVLALSKIDDWDFAGAENDYKRAIELNPNFATAHQWYSELLARLGRHDEALVEINRAYELDPFSRAVNMELGLKYLDMRRYDEAVAQFKKLIETEPTYPLPYSFLGFMYAEKGMYEEAIALICKSNILLNIETTESCERKAADLRQALKTGGGGGFWRKVLEYHLKYYERGIGSAVAVAGVYARLGEKERAFEWLEKAFAEHDNEITYLKLGTVFDNVKSDSRFQDLLRRIGLPQ